MRPIAIPFLLTQATFGWPQAVAPRPSAPLEGPAPAPSSCTVTLNASYRSVPARGQIVEVKTQNLPADCTPAVAVRSDWAQRLTATEPGNVRLSVTANGSKDSRTTTVHIADKVLVIEQEGVEALPVSVVPGRLAFGMDPKKAPEPRRITVQADDPTAAVAVACTAEWLTATPVKGRTREYEIRIDPARVPPGQHADAAVRVSAGAATVDVPVVVERMQLR